MSARVPGTRVRHPALVATAIAFLLSMFAGSEARGAFAPTIGPLVDNASVNGDVAIDAQGNTLVIWSYRVDATVSVVQGHRISVTGDTGQTFDIGVPGQHGAFPAVAFAPNGRAYVVWRARDATSDNDGVKGRWIEPDNTLAGVQTLVTGNDDLHAVDLDVVIDPAGTATPTWENGDPGQGSLLQARRVNQAGALGALVPDMSGGGVTNARTVALPDGSTLATWRDGGIDASVLFANGVVGAPIDLSAGGSAADPSVAADALGNVLVVWRLGSGADWLVRGRRVSPSGVALGGEITIEPAATPFVGGVAVAADSDGDFLVSWDRQHASGKPVVFGRRLNANAEFAGPAQVLSSANGDGNARSPAAALTDRGSGAVAWDLSSASQNMSQGREVDSLAAPIGGVANFTLNAYDVDVASAPPVGTASFLSETPTSGATQALYVSRYLIAPLCSDSEATVAKGKASDLPLACSGPGMEAAQLVEQPKHGKIGNFNAAGPALAYTPDAGYTGADTFVFRAVNDGGSSGNARVRIKDIALPEITSLRFSQARPKAKRKAGKQNTGATARKKKAKRSYKFRLAFSEASSTRVTVERPVRGVRRGKKCRPHSGKRRAGKRCTLYRSVGTLSARKFVDKATLTATGKLARRLGRGGRYRASARATDSAGGKSKVKRLTIRAKR